MLGLFSCQACVKNETGKGAVGVIDSDIIEHILHGMFTFQISSSFRPAGLLFVRRSLQQSVPRDAPVAAVVAADGSTYVGLKPARRLLEV